MFPIFHAKDGILRNKLGQGQLPDVWTVEHIMHTYLSTVG